MTALEIRAIKLLPDELVRDKTLICRVGYDGEYVVAMWENFEPWCFENGAWRKMDCGFVDNQKHAQNLMECRASAFNVKINEQLPK